MALVSGNSYNIHDIARSWEPAPAAQEAALWYQYYFHSERGRRGLFKNRRDIARQLWRMWSPNWGFDEATFERTAPSFDNPDFVEVVIHSYRQRYGLVPGDPAYAHIETRLTAQPPISVPAITIDGDADGINFGTAHHAKHFIGPHEHRIFAGGQDIICRRSDPRTGRGRFWMCQPWLGQGPESPGPLRYPCGSRDQARSKRSAFITLVQAATKSFANFSFESAHA